MHARACVHACVRLRIIYINYI